MSFSLSIQNYQGKNLNILETEIAIKKLKDYFERELAKKLNLIRVSAPLFVRSESGVNDYLNGIERPVSFNVINDSCKVEIVQSLAKWKRLALKKYGFKIGEGLYTDMNAIRPDEKVDNIHSVYVDQWDWEKIISKEDRNEEKLKEIVKDIYSVLKTTESYVYNMYPFIDKILPKDIFFITTQELEDLYPDMTPKEREDAITKEKRAVFIMKIGDKLKSGIKHDGRSPDYDDWNLNGDILVWDPVIEQALELSSMGIRVDSIALDRQLRLAKCEERREFMFHKMLLNDELPFTVGGGIGQSRLCMFFLRKAHIGEVQSSVWPEEMIKECSQKGIFLL